MKYAIKLTSSPKNYELENVYGYYTGKDYVVHGMPYPICFSDFKSGTVKVYSSKKRAENALEKILARPYEYVCDGEVVEVEDEHFK